MPQYTASLEDTHCLLVDIYMLLNTGLNWCRQIILVWKKTHIKSHYYNVLLTVLKIGLLVFKPFLMNMIYPDNYDAKTFLPLLKQRIIDCFKQQLFFDMENNNVLNILYSHVKTSFGLENYLNLLICKRSRRCLTRLRISAHNLRIYGNNRLQRQDRLCPLCYTRDIEDEFHFVFKCKAYGEIRKLYIKCYYFKKTNM